MWIADEDENEDDDIVTQGDDQSNVETPEEKDPQAVKGESVRESIKRALMQASEEGEVDEEAASKSSDKEVEDTDKKEVVEEPKKKVTSPKISADTPPVGWTKQAKAQWANLPLEIRESVAKREKEVSDGFKDYGDKVKNFEAKEKDFNEIENVFTPREQELQRLGVTKAQVVNQMFQWIDAFTHQDRNYAASQFIQLAKNYGITLQVAGQQQQQPVVQQQTETKKDDQQQQPQTSVNDPRISAIETRLQQQDQQRIREQNQAAQQYVNNWAKDKTYFKQVRQAMFGLLQSGAVPLKNGELDLDSAYDQAVNANPVTRELLRKEEADKAAAKAKADKDAKDLANLKKVNKSRVAASSISTRAPTGASVPNQGKNGKPPSVRDSLKQSISELRDNS